MRERTVTSSDKTEERILDAALDVIEEKTISGTRLRLIADQAGLFQSNIHYYYKSKRDLLLAVQKKVLRRCIDLREADRNQKVGEDIDSQLDVYINQKKEFIQNSSQYDYAELDFWVQARNDADMKAEFCVSFANWRKEISDTLEVYAPHMTEDHRSLCAAMFVSMLEGATIQYLMDPEVFDLDRYFALGKQMLMDQIDRERPEISLCI